MGGDQTYFMRRAAQERAAADRARGAKAKNAHEMMADRYRDLVLASERAPTEAGA